MTEDEWLACTDPRPMLEHLRGRIDDRRLRLFACAVARSGWDCLRMKRGRDAIEVAEQFADGTADEARLHRAHSMARDAVATAFRPPKFSSVPWPPGAEEYWWQFWAAETAHRVQARLFLIGRLLRVRQFLTPAAAKFLHCIVGNPFAPLALADACQTPTVQALARAAYEERALPSGELDAERLAVLADALEDAGATGDVLAHLRGPGPHVRGCHALDAALGRV